MIEPRTMYEVTVYDYGCLDKELKRYTDHRYHNMYVTKFAPKGTKVEVTVSNFHADTGEEFTMSFILDMSNIYSVRNVKTNEYLFSMSPGLKQKVN